MKIRFSGSEYQPARDDIRLTTQLLRVWESVKSGAWLTLDEIARSTGDPAPSISAQLRHLRKKRFGAHTVEKQYMGSGLYTYRVLPNNTNLVR